MGLAQHTGTGTSRSRFSSVRGFLEGLKAMKFAQALVVALALGGAALPQVVVGAPAQTATHKVIDINSASESDLEQLQGIGPTMAKKIIQGRPYKSKDELVRRKIIPVSAYGPIKDHVIAHHMT